MSQEIAVREQQPIVTPAEADRVLEMIRAFDYFKAHALSKNDIVEIQRKPYVKKSGWSKYALACNVSTELRDERVEERNDRRIYHFTYRAIHLPSGRFADAVGTASEAEKPDWNHPEHDVRTLAQTRAFNRAISNLVGGGEVSAEEMQENDVAPPPKPRSAPPTRATVNLTDSGRHDEEDSIMGKLAKAGLTNSDMVSVYKYGNRIHVQPTHELAENWDQYDKALVTMGAIWNQQSERWEIPLPYTKQSVRTKGSY